MKLPAYPKYKPSGVGWLGDVPEQWEVCALKRIISMKSGESITFESIEESGEYPVFGGNGLRGFACKFTHDGHYVLIGRQGALCGNINYARGRFWASEHAVVATPLKKVGTIWLGEMMRAMNLNQYSVSAAQPGLSVDLVGSLATVLPPLPEQVAIADFLDRETRKVDTLVAKKRTLVERLKEKRTALISRTVTRGLPPDAARAAGLDPHPKLKPSGIDWLGDVPEHWAIVPVRRCAKRIQTGGTPPTAEDRYYEDGTIPWYGPGSFDDQIVVTHPVKLLHVSAVTDEAARMFSAGATMVVTIGATLGKVSSLPHAASCNQQITVIEFDLRRVHPRFATYQIKRLESSLRTIAPSATLPILDQGEIAEIVMCLPSIEEQAAIADFLDRETIAIDRMISKIDSVIERLQEYRTALITAAVTGKIDVRQLAAKGARA
ncbi:MAG: restriction endonuclease subunit S [Polyangia bacterium]